MDVKLIGELANIQVRFSAEECRRWGTALSQLLLSSREKALLGGNPSPSAGAVEVARGSIEKATEAPNPGDARKTDYVFETAYSSRNVFAAAAGIAELALANDYAPPQLHADLMVGLYDGQVNDYYRPRAAQQWHADGVKFAELSDATINRG